MSVGNIVIAGSGVDLEYNVGFATYKMGDMKSLLDEAKPSLNHVKTTDNFPGYITHQAKLGLEWRKLHQAGLLLDFMNTVGNKGVSDYSASYNFPLHSYERSSFRRILSFCFTGFFGMYREALFAVFNRRCF